MFKTGIQKRFDEINQRLAAIEQTQQTHTHMLEKLIAMEKKNMTDQETIDALTARILAADDKVAALEAKSVADDQTIADLNAKIAAIPPAPAPLDLSAASKAVDGLEAALVPAAAPTAG